MTENNEEIKRDQVLKNSWQIRPCHLYKEEYNDCTSVKGRFHQYFIHGETIDCTQWKRDYNNCCNYDNGKDIQAGKEIIESETNRRKKRLLPHYKNDTWERRKSPPTDWNRPLPEWMAKEFEHSYLNIKSKELKGESPPTVDVPNSFCTIM